MGGSSRTMEEGNNRNSLYSNLTKKSDRKILNKYTKKMIESDTSIHFIQNSNVTAISYTNSEDN